MVTSGDLQYLIGRYLQPGEEVEAVFGALPGRARLLRLLRPLSALVSPRVRRALGTCYLVVATNRRMLLVDTGTWDLRAVRAVRAVVAEVPRLTRLGVPRGTWHRLRLAGYDLRVHRTFFDQIQLSDHLGERHFAARQRQVPRSAYGVPVPAAAWARPAEAAAEQRYETSGRRRRGRAR